MSLEAACTNIRKIAQAAKENERNEPEKPVLKEFGQRQVSQRILWLIPQKVGQELTFG